MGSQLSWLEHTPDKREVDGPSPFEPTKVLFRTEYGLGRANENPTVVGGNTRCENVEHTIAKQAYGQIHIEQIGRFTRSVNIKKINNCIAR